MARSVQMPHRRAAEAAGRVAALTVLVSSYAFIAAVVVAISWAGDRSDRTMALGSVTARWTDVAHAIGITALAVTGGVAAMGAYRTGQGSLAQGQGVHVSLLLSAGGSLGVGVALAAFGIIYDLGLTGLFPWSCPCVCTGLVPFVVGGLNILVLIRHGGALRQDERLVEGV